MSMRRLPNFLHLGPGKSGSTWLHETLSQHPEVYLTEAKDLYYFSRYYDRGQNWYRDQFRAARPEQIIVGEVCPDYLAAAGTAERIKETLGPAVRLMVTLRDPVDRAFSHYLYLQKHGQAARSFRETASRSPELIHEGRYGTQLTAFTKLFDTNCIRVSLFDDLERDPQAYVDATTDWLGVGRLPLNSAQLAPRLPASSARFLPIASAAQEAAHWLREHNQAKLVGLVKRSAILQDVLYRPLGQDRPLMEATDAAMVKDVLEDEMRRVEDIFALPLRRMWNW